MLVNLSIVIASVVPQYKVVFVYKHLRKIYKKGQALTGFELERQHEVGFQVT